MAVSTEDVKRLARECGFELAGVTAARPADDFARFEAWRLAGYAGEMRYLTDHRGELRADPRHLLPSAVSMVCVGKLYNTGTPGDSISQYAAGADYHDLMRANLTQLAERIQEAHGQVLEWRACVDTAPLLERSYARAAGLGWIGRNTCLINQASGSWFFLGELLLSVPLAVDAPPPDRCGTCRRCIDACPTDALVPDETGGWTLDSRRCISYLTIEKRGPLEPDAAAMLGEHVFGCDICQDACPWNRQAPVTEDDALRAAVRPQALPDLAALSAEAFRELFRHSPVWRAKYEGFLRNVAIAMGNSGRIEMEDVLSALATHPLPQVMEPAKQSLQRLQERFAELGAH